MPFTGGSINIAPKTYKLQCVLELAMMAVGKATACKPTGMAKPLSVTTCCRHELNLFRLSGIQVEPFIAKSRSSPPSTFIIFHKRQSSQAPSQAPDSVYSGRILSLPDGYHLFRTDIISSGRVLFIPSGCWTSEAFQVYLYSYAVPQQ